MDISLKRLCPLCNSEILYVSELTYDRAEKKNRICRSCSQRKSQSYHLHDLSTQKFGRLTVISRHPENRNGRPQWNCKCDCGNEIIATSNHLRNGGVRSCGCLQKEVIIGRLKKSPFLYLYNRLKYNASRRRIVIDLSFDEFKEFTKNSKCHYCDSNIIWHPHSNSGGCNLDRKDFNIGYIKTNCVVCCKICNSVKNKYFSHTEMIELGKHIKTITSKRICDIYNHNAKKTDD